MKIKAFFYYSFILGEWLFAPTKWNAIHRIHNTHKSISPLWGSVFMLIFIRGLHPCLWAFRPSGTTAAASIKSTLKG